MKLFTFRMFDCFRVKIHMPCSFELARVFLILRTDKFLHKLKSTLTGGCSLKSVH